MKKTQISYEDIKAGDLLEIFNHAYGLETLVRGVADHETRAYSDKYWLTSKGGIIVFNYEDETDIIYRVEEVDVEVSCPVHLMDGRNEIRCWYPKGHEGDCR